MKNKILVLMAVTAAFLAAAPARATETSKPKYNVLFIISDDLRPELGSYGSKLAKTPNLDKFAASGVRFDRGYCQYPLCNPSRASMLTGRKPTTSGVIGNRTWFGDLHPDYVSLPRYFKDQGYFTAKAGKIFHGGIDDTDAWTVGGERRTLAGVPRPVGETNAPVAPRTNQVERLQEDVPSRAARSDRWIVVPGAGEEQHDYRVGTQTINLLQQHKDEPFFIACGFSTPHSPPTAPQRFYDLYDVAKIPLPPDFAARPTVPEGFPKSAIRPRNADLFINRDATPETAREMIRAYLAATSWVDFNVGRVLAEVDRLNLWTNTVVVFWGDHGYQLGEKGKWSKAGSLFEQGARVPFIVRAPEAKGNGRSSPRVVETLDFYPTLVELTGLPQPKGLEGRSLVPLLNNPAAPWEHPAFTVWSENGRTLHGVTVRNERWRYAEYEDGGAMLLDLENDPQELKNVADDPRFAAERTALSKLVRDYRAGFVPVK